MGLRTWRYRPVTTRFCVGAIGAGVPNPCNAKRANESTMPGRPATINRIPTARVASRSKKGGRNSQRVIHHGTSPATELGATAKKRAEPNTAIVFGTAPPSRPVAKFNAAMSGQRLQPDIFDLAVKLDGSYSATQSLT